MVVSMAVMAKEDKDNRINFDDDADVERSASTGSTNIWLDADDEGTRAIPSADQPICRQSARKDPIPMAIRIGSLRYWRSSHTVGKISPYTSSWR